MADWNCHYKDLMHRSDKALKLFHSYEEKERNIVGGKEGASAEMDLAAPLSLGCVLQFCFSISTWIIWIIRVFAILLLLPMANAHKAH